MKYDGDGDYYEVYGSQKCSIPGAYSESVIFTEQQQEYPTVRNEPVAYIDDNGNPQIKYERIEIWNKTADWWIKRWKSVGYDHQYNEIDHIWTRKLNQYRWFVDLDEPECWKQLLDWLISGDIYEIDLIDNQYHINVYL